MKICLILHTCMSLVRNTTSHISRGCINLISITWECNNVVYYMGCNMDFSKWRSDILHQIEYLAFHNCNVFFFKYFTVIHVFRSDQLSLLMYLCLLSSSATVKMDIGENMENARYATNDDTAGFINQMKNINTSREQNHIYFMNQRLNHLVLLNKSLSVTVFII